MAALSLVLGAGLLVLAVPRTVAAWNSLGTAPAMAKLRVGDAASTDELARCVEASERAIAWTASAVRFANLGSCEFALARQAAVLSRERNRWLELAEAHTEQSLQRDPTDGFTWIRLAMMRELHGAAVRDVIAPLVKSLEVTPNARPMWPLRSEMLLIYAPLLPPEDSAALRRHLHTIWTFAPAYRPALLNIAHGTRRVDVLRAALVDDPDAIAEFDTMERQSRFP